MTITFSSDAHRTGELRALFDNELPQLLVGEAVELLTLDLIEIIHTCQ